MTREYVTVIVGREAVMALAAFPAGSETGRHTHPGEEISFVEAGPFVLEIDGQPARTLKTGEVFSSSRLDGPVTLSTAIPELGTADIRSAVFFSVIPRNS